jgi:hypothetical protein
MKIVVNHLTRMQPGCICVAGIDMDTGRHVRPVLERTRLTSDLLSRNGGPFDFGSVVDLGETRYIGQLPETEDYLFDLRRTARLEDPEPDKFWTMLREASRSTLFEIFGDALKQQGATCAVDTGAGHASLGSLSLPKVHVQLDRYGTIRVPLASAGLYANLPVTDLRFYEDDYRTPRSAVVENFAHRLRGGELAILSIGLTRPWQRPGDVVTRHWLQVNNIILEGDPLWRGA